MKDLVPAKKDKVNLSKNNKIKKDKKIYRNSFTTKISLAPLAYEGVLKLPIIDERSIKFLKIIESKINLLMVDFPFSGAGSVVVTVEFDKNGMVSSIKLNGAMGDKDLVNDILELIHLGEPYFDESEALADKNIVQLYFDIESN